MFKHSQTKTVTSLTTKLMGVLEKETAAAATQKVVQSAETTTTKQQPSKETNTNNNSNDTAAKKKRETTTINNKDKEKDEKNNKNNNNDDAMKATPTAATPTPLMKTIGSKEKTQTSKELTTKTKTSEDGDDKRPPPISAVTPPISFPADVLAEAGKGVKKDNIENEYFDPSFFKNQVAMRQHDPLKRPKPINREVISDPNAGDESNVIKVIAKEVLPLKDKLCYLTVKQSTFLGAGAFSDVFVGYVSKTSRRSNNNDQHEPMQVAVKKIWPDPSREDRQIGVHRNLDHVNLVKLRFYYVCIHPKTKMTMWTLIMDLMPSTVAHEQSRYIEKGKIMPFLYIKLFIYQTFAGLHYMEKAGYFHRDVKPENLLVCMSSGRLKIGDFGSAKHYKQGAKLSSYQVTRYYRAPELCLRFNFYDPTVDVWAAGCILAELLTNRIIFYGANNRDQIFKILRICGTPTMAQLSQCVPGVTVDDEILATNYPAADWLKIVRRYNKSITPIGADFLHKVLRYERALRLRGDEALKHAFFDSLRNPACHLPNDTPLPPLIGINC